MKRQWALLWIGLWGTASAGMALRLRLQDALPIPHELARALQAPFYDTFGRNLVALVLSASAASLALTTLVVALALGTALLLAALPRTALLERGTEVLLAFPAILVSLSVAALRGPGWVTLGLSLFLALVPMHLRLLLARSRELRRQEFYQAALSLGAPPLRLFITHELPALWALTRVKAPHHWAVALVADATLSYLGIGAPIGDDSWGSLLLQGQQYLIEAPHIALLTGVPLVLSVLSLQILSRYPKNL